VGWVYVTKAKAREEFGKRLTKARLAKVEECLRGEVKTYDDYLTGNVWGFIVEDEDGNHVDSCWGFVGDVDYAFAEGKAAAECYLQSEEKAEQSVKETFAL
jgi:hypothetical protein